MLITEYCSVLFHFYCCLNENTEIQRIGVVKSKLVMRNNKIELCFSNYKKKIMFYMSSKPQKLRELQHQQETSEDFFFRLAEF